MTDNDIIYCIYPPGQVCTEIERELDEYPYPPDVHIEWVERKEYECIDLSYEDVAVIIDHCKIELVHGETKYGQCFRSYRILTIDGMRVMTYPCHHYPIFLIPDNMIKGTLLVDDGRERHRYIIDRWYDCDKTRNHDIHYNDPPDIVPALALLFRPYLLEDG